MGLCSPPADQGAHCALAACALGSPPSCLIGRSAQAADAVGLVGDLEAEDPFEQVLERHEAGDDVALVDHERDGLVCIQKTFDGLAHRQSH